MALTDRQFEALREQLRNKRNKLGEQEYQSFIGRASTSAAKIQRVTEPEQQPGGLFGGFARGLAKGIQETELGIGTIGRGIQKRLPSFLQGFGARAAERGDSIFDKESAARARVEASLEPTTSAEEAGRFVEKTAEFAAPISKVSKVFEGANFLARLGSRILTSGGVATLQAGEIGEEAKTAAIIEGALGVGGAVAKPIFSVIKRLFKGLGSGLSGVSTDVIDTIVENPQKAIEVTKQLERSGNFGVLEENARTIVSGVSKIRQEARQAFGEGLKGLKEQDITPKTFRSSVQKFLDSVGSVVKGDERTLSKVEFENPKLIQKASNLIEQLQDVKLDGLSLRKLLNRVENSKFKTTGTDTDKLSFNAFIKDFGQSIKTAISDSTDKLDDINKKFSADLQLTEGIERIFGKIKFKSLKEVDAVAKKLESLFSQKGLDPRSIDNFLERLGVSPQEFRTSEAVRQISSGVERRANEVGLTFSELIQSLTSAVITPDAIKNASIVTGIAGPAMKVILEKVAPSARGALMEFLIENQE